MWTKNEITSPIFLLSFDNYHHTVSITDPVSKTGSDSQQTERIN